MSEIAQVGGSGPLRGLLLAAGAGTRLRPLTEAVPKVAVPLLDVPLGALGLRLLEGALGDGLAMNVSHLGSAARAALGPLFPRLEIFDEGESPLGTAGTLAALRGRLADRIATVNGDLVTDLDLADLVTAHEASGAPATVAVVQVSSGADFEGGAGRLSHFADRRAGSPGAPGFLYIGAAVLERAALDLIPSTSGQVGLAEAVLRPLTERGDLAYHLHEGYARDVGTVPRYLATSLDVLEGRGPSVGAPGAIVDVPGGRAYVGPGAKVADGTLGPGGVVLAGARVEGRVRRAVVWPGEHVPPGVVVEGGVWFRGALLPG